jgi:DNA-binding PadR family transcriptional regulator
MTAYAVQKTFLASPTDHFSGSAGSIYPLIRRISAAGLIAPSSRAKGTKGGAAFALTKEGRASLKAWLIPGRASSLASVTFDPLRTRVLTLGLLSRRERTRFFDHAERELAARVREQSRRLKDESLDKWLAAACQGALDVTRARLRWIRALRRADQE